MSTTLTPHTSSGTDRLRRALEARPRIRPRVTRRDAKSLGAFALATAGAAGIGTYFGPVKHPLRTSLWYRRRRRRSLLPPPKLFGRVLTALYPLIAVSGWRVWRATRSGGPSRRRALGLWATQLGLNAAWGPLFFGRRRKRAALADAVALLGTVGAYTATARRVDRPAAWLIAPYLGWVGFATYLNAGMARRHA